MPLPQGLQDFARAHAPLQVWLYKKSVQGGGGIRFTGRWIDTDEELDRALRQAVTDKRNSILEVNTYSLLAAANDGIALLPNPPGVVMPSQGRPMFLRMRRAYDV